ncbi:tubulin polyglutamylase complex subunit 2 [Anoplophora glabripennis]|uniref:tubulin polyglutamylase complex subunit 2 n=1 Tax=Anoplophora glabripennis TaxID=217634 RepID=UPI0008754F45|nr:tubulin polyglutamylase complex subunit 2 [Anoplophora glabripennis]
MEIIVPINRNMGFVVDKVSEDSFYENLLLGLSKVLEKSPCISNISLKRFPGVRQIDIRAWEHNNSVILPEDLRAFYSSTNGFLYTYDFSYDYNSTENADTLIREGSIKINGLNEIERIYGYETKNVAQIEQYGKNYMLVLSRESKVFELAAVDNYAKVVLVYINTYCIPSIWLYSSPMSFNYLAEDLTTYFRMCLAHLGIPCWQYIVSREGLPEWAREIFQLIAPGVLNEDRNLVEIPKHNPDDINKIDPNIFVIPTSSMATDRNSTLQMTQQKGKEKKSKFPQKRFVSGKGVKK